MDDLLREFLTETNEALDTVDRELVRFEKNPKDKEALDKIFRLVHTVKGTCGFLGLPRLEAVAHAAETVLGRFRDGALEVTPPAVSLILKSIDRIKEILIALEASESEPEGSDADLIDKLDEAAAGLLSPAPAAEAPAPTVAAAPPAPAQPATPAPKTTEAPLAGLKLTEVALGRKLKPGEVSLDELEAAFANAPGPEEESASAKADAADGKKNGSGAAGDEADRKPGESQLAKETIRVNVTVLEDLMTLVSELVLTRNQLLQMARNQENSEFKVPLQRLSNVTSDLQDSVMKTRMQPIGNAWAKLPRIVRDLAQELGKKIQLEMIGAETELDRQVLELIKDPLTHMVRNSADHGLESIADRRSAGKPDEGKITLKAYHEGGHIIIEVGDDGRGLNIKRIREKALKQGLASEAELDRMSDSQIQKFIFHPGFSTAAAVTNVSGRGVGLDVVRSNVEIIGGVVDLQSYEGKGTTFSIKIPLTLAIVSALIVEAEGQRFAIPQISVVELVRAKPGSEHRIEFIERTPVLRLRNRLLPLVDLTSVLSLKKASETANRREDAFVVVTQVGSQTFGIIVDGVFDTEEIVVKPSASMLREISMFSGNTILGDGSVIMIIDPNGIASAVGHQVADAQSAKEAATESRQAANDLTSLLIFRAGSAEPKAVPLSLVTRLEEVDAERIEPCDGRYLVQYRGRLMPVMHVAAYGEMRTTGRQPILVFSDGERSLGLAVDEIVDITEEKLAIELGSSTPGILGSATIKGRATEVIEIGHYLIKIHPDWFDRMEADAAETRSRRVLLVDDSPFFLNMLTPLLSAAGYNVTAVPSADDALRLRDAGERFDAIVSDIEMPGTDGFTFATFVKSDETWRETPIIALSSRVAPEDIARGEQAGFDGHIAKSERDRIVEVLSATIALKGEAA